MASQRNWIKSAIKHPGALRAGFPGKAKGGFSNAELKGIIKSKSSSPTEKRRARLAITLKGFNKKG